jgi:hypothetical protein
VNFARLRALGISDEADKADKEDARALLSAFVAIIAIWAAAFLLTKAGYRR